MLFIKSSGKQLQRVANARQMVYAQYETMRWELLQAATNKTTKKNHRIHVNNELRVGLGYMRNALHGSNDGDDSHGKWQKCKFMYEYPFAY